MFLARINFDARVVKPLLRIGVFNSIHFDFILVPCRDVNSAINVVEFHAAVGSKSVGLMEFLGKCAPVIGGVSSERENEQGADGSQNCTQPGGELALSVHWLPPF